MRIQNSAIVREVLEELETYAASISQGQLPEQLGMKLLDLADDLENIIGDETQRFFWLPEETKKLELKELGAELQVLVNAQMELVGMTEGNHDIIMVDLQPVIAPLQELLK